MENKMSEERRREEERSSGQVAVKVSTKYQTFNIGKDAKQLKIKEDKDHGIQNSK
jgi:hypothetical protein